LVTQLKRFTPIIIVALTTLMMFFPFNLKAQEYLCSEVMKSTRLMRNMNIIGSDDLGFYVTDENDKEQFVRISYYDFAGLKPIWSENISVPENDYEQQFEQIIQLNDKFLFFTSRFSKDSEQFQIFCTFLDKKGKPMNEPALVHYVLSEGRSSAPVFGATLSPDKTKMLLYFDPPFERKSSEAVSFKCYTTELEMLWEKDILLPYTQEVVQVHSFLLDNDVNIYMMSGRNPSKSGHQWQKPQGGRYVVFFYNATNNKLKEYDVSLKDKQVLSVIFQFNKEQDVVITGYYSNDFRFSASGTFLFTIGAGGTAVKAASFMPFAKDFVAKLVRTNRSDSEAALPDFYLDHMILEADGSMILIGEQYYATENTITDPTTGRQTIEFRYNFDDIIVTRIEPSGRHMWNLKIPKRQYTTSDTKVCSYQCFDNGKSLMFYFNDHPENQQRLSAMMEGDAALWSGSKSSVTTRVILDKTGTFKREVLFSNKEKDALLNTFYGLKSLNGPQLLGYEDGKSYKFCYVK
jgi:hypothetical protein